MKTTAKTIVLSSVAAILVGSTLGAAELQHRYSFNESAGRLTVHDSVGGGAWDGALYSTNGGSGFTGSGTLILGGTTNGFVDLPNNIVTGYTAVTFEAWVTDNGSAPWARIYDFGDNNGGEGAQGLGTRYMFLALPAAGNILRGAYTINSYTNEQILEWSSNRPPVGQGTYIAWTSDAATHTGRLFVNGTQVAVNTNMTLSPALIGPTYNDWLGKSQYSPDPYFKGSFDEFRIWKGALSPAEISEHAALGPDLLSASANITSQPEDITVVTTAPATFRVGASGLPPVSVQWYRNGTLIPAATNSVYTLPAAALADSGAVFSAVVSNSVQSTPYSVTSSNAVLTVLNVQDALIHRWSFTYDASDSVGHADGVLMNGATITNGTVKFNGIDSYVNLPCCLLNGLRSLTIEFWASFATNGDWARVYDFGDKDASGVYGTSYIFFTPHSGTNTDYKTPDYRMVISDSAADDGWLDEDRLFVPGTLDGRTNVCVACVYDTPNDTMSLYVNGTLQGTAQCTMPLADVRDVYSYLGYSLYAGNGDAYLNGSIDEFRMYKCALTSQQIAASYAAGPDVHLSPPYLSATRSNEDLGLSFTTQAGYDYHVQVTDRLLPPVTWTNALDIPGNGGTVEASFPITASNSFYRVSAGDATNGVFSVNVVGCINLPVAGGYNLVANPLSPYGFGMGAILTNVVDGTKMAEGGTYETDYHQASGWSDPNVTFGTAVLFSPQAASYTLLGDVMGGMLTNSIPAGLSLCWSLAPWAGGLTSVLGFPAENGDQIWTYDSSSQSYQYFYYAGGWQPSEPTLQVGESFWVQTTSPKTWVQDLSVVGGPGEEVLNGLPNADPFAAPTITAQPQRQTNLSGNNVTFAVTATGAPPLTYHWQFNGTNLPGAVETNLTLTNLQLTDSGNYAVSVSDAYGSVTSEVAVLTVLPPPTPPVITAFTVSGNNLVLSFPGQLGYDYQLQVSTNLVPPVAWSNVAISPQLVGTNFQIAVPTASSMNAFYRVVVNNTVYSSNVVGYVNVPVSAGNNLIANQLEPGNDSITNVLTSVTNDSVLLELTADGKSFTNSIYQQSFGWTDPNMTLPPGKGAFLINEFGYSGILTFVGEVPQEARTNQIPAGLSLCSSLKPLAGGITSVLGFQPGEGDKVYFYDTHSQSYSNPYVFTAGAWSPSEPLVGIGEAFWIWATNSATGGYIKAIPYTGGTNSLVPPVFGTSPNITTQPQDQTVLAGSNVTFSVTATGTTPLHYQWHFNATNSIGGNSSNLTLTDVQSSDAGTYSVTVSNAVGWVNSTDAVLTVLPPPTPPTIVYSVNGNQLTISWPAELGYYGYQLQIATNLVPPVAWSDVPGSGSNIDTNNYFSFALVPSMNAFYRLSVNNTVYSSNIVGYVNVPVSAGTNLIANQLWPADAGITNVLADAAAGSLLLEVAGSSFAESFYYPSYGWTDPNLTLTPGKGAILISPQPGILTFVGEVPQGAPTNEVPAGLSLCSSVAPLAGGVTSVLGFQPGEGDQVYLYETNSQSYSNPYVFTSGAWSPSEPVVGIGEAFWISATSSAAGGYVRAIPYFGGANSLVPPVFGTAPSITTQPQDQTVLAGSNVTFSVTAAGTTPLHYQWHFDDTNSLGGNSSNLTLTDVQSSDSGTYSVTVSNAAGWVNSTDAVLTVMTPCLSVSADHSTYAMDGTLALHVQAFDCLTSNSLANLPVVVWISADGTIRSNLVTTDSSGQATAYFQPLAGEAGYYAISAALPGQPIPTAQSSFAIVGVGFSTNELTHQLIVGAPVTNTITLRNLTDVPLSGVTATLVNAPTNLTVQLTTPATLAANATNNLTYVLQATGATPGQSQCLLRVTSAQGSTNDLPLTIKVVPPVPQLVITPSSLDAAMLRGSQSLATLSVANVGGAASGDLQVQLPNPEPGWLGLVTPAAIPSLAPNEQVPLTLSLTPSNNLALGPYTGAMALATTNAGQTDVPFQFDCVSDLKGNLRVTAVDEFTYYAAGAPKVTNAVVTLLDPYARTNIVSAVTDSNGVALFTNLTEAYYEVSVRADQHGGFDTTVLVPGDQTLDLTAFLARQMVSYSWIVTTSSIPDRYNFTLNTRFETDVPAPVIRVEPGALDLCDYEAPTNIINLNIINSGLVAAQSARLVFADNPRFVITPLTENIGDIPAETNVVVPVIIRRLSGTNEGPSSIAAHLDYQLPGDIPNKYRELQIPVYNAGLHDCDANSPGSIPTTPPVVWTGGGTSTGGGSGSASGGLSGVLPGTSPSRPYITPPPTFILATNTILPVQVGVQLSQSAVMTRNDLLATLEISNGSMNSLTNLNVTLDIRDSNGVSANNLFGIYPPVLTGLNAVDGTGGLGALASGQAEWRLVPTTNAAPDGPVTYTVGGTVSYQQAGQDVQIPLFHVPVTVLPDARLVVDYFWQRTVYGDDPLTPEIEPAVPFGVGLRIKNVGFGTAQDVRITSAQPEIVNNTSGLRVNFQLLNTQVGTQTVSPSLTADLGDIAPGTNAVAIWLMTASLQGEFTNFSASFSHVDDLGDGRLSLIASISNHPLVHIVRADVPNDDGIPDFLVSDGYPTNTLPNNLYLSDGSVAPVTSVTNGTIDAPLGPGHTNVLLTASVPPGWVYLRVPDPGPGATISFVRRSDGRFLMLGYNVWTTHRIIHPLVGNAYNENYFHLLDYNSTGSYTIGYNISLNIVAQPQSRTNVVGSTARFSVEASGTTPLSYQWLWFGNNLAGETNATLTITNVQAADAGMYSVLVSNIAGTVTSDEAELTVWAPPTITSQPVGSTNLAGASATFMVSASGTTPFSYQWFRDQTNLPGATGPTLTLTNLEPADAGNYTVTVANYAGSVTSQPAHLAVLVPPCLEPVPNQSVAVGGLLIVTNRGCDPNLPLTFSLCAGPLGSSVTTNGIFTWTPVCAQGSTTNLVLICATENTTPPVSNSVTFFVTVPECVHASLGRTVVQVGQTSSVPVSLLSTIELTNLNFSVPYSTSRFTNFALVVNTQQVSTPFLSTSHAGRLDIRLTLPANKVLHGPTNVGTLFFLARTNQSSAFVPLPITDITGVKPDGSLAANVYGQPGRVVVVDGQPLLEAFLNTNRNVTLILYATPGSTNEILAASNLISSPWWTSLPQAVQTNLVEFLNAGSPTNQMQFFRAKRP